MIKRLIKLFKRNKVAHSLGLPLFLGIGKFKTPHQITYQKKDYDVHFPDFDPATSDLIFIEIFLDDCYEFSSIPKPIRKIIDLGANMGFASMKMGLMFQPELLIAFEPNPILVPFLNANLNFISNKIIEIKAVGFENGKVDLIFTERENHVVSGLTKANLNHTGSTEMVCFSSIIEKYGPIIDLVKMDIEGAEWLFLHDESWKKVRYLTLEYHLDTEDSAKKMENLKILIEKHFSILKLSPIDNQTGMILAKSKWI